EMVLAQDAFARETGFFIAADAGGGVGVDVELDAIEIQRLEAVAQHQTRGLGTGAFAAQRRPADHDAEVRMAVHPVDAMPADAPNGMVAIPLDDGESHVVAGL